MKTRLPWPRLGQGSTLYVADAEKVTQNYVRLLEKFNGRLSDSDMAPQTPLANSKFAETNAWNCYSFFYDSGVAPNYQWILPVANQSGCVIQAWALCEVNSFNSSARSAGKQAQIGWTSALTAILSDATASTTLSTITRAARSRVDTSGSRGGLPDADVLHIAHDIAVGNYTAGHTLQVAISTNLPSNGGYIVYVFYTVPWTGGLAAA